MDQKTLKSNLNQSCRVEVYQRHTSIHMKFSQKPFQEGSSDKVRRLS